MRIAVISALPAGLNTGMLCVDLAFKQLCNVNDDWHITHYCFEAEFSLDFQEYGAIKYIKSSNSRELENNDLIIFWGDFLHWRGYLHQDIIKRNLSNKSSLEIESYIDQYYSYFFFENNPALIKKTIWYGGSIYLLNYQDFNDARYLKNISNSLTKLPMAKFRDSISSTYAELISNNSSKSYLGIDPAFF